MKRMGAAMAAVALLTGLVGVELSSDPAEAGAAQAIGAKNVILFVGDGMGLPTVTAARILQGQQAGGPGEGNELSFELFPEVGLSQVYSINFQVPDSAATMTAMMTARKTDSFVLNVNKKVVRGNCSTVAGNELSTWFMEAEAMGLATGIVTTARLSHATPAAAYAISSDRNYEADSNLPDGCEHADISSQLIDFPYGDGIEVALGGGRRTFLPNTVTDPELTALKGIRKDGRNLTTEWAARPDASYVWNQAGFDNVDLNTTNHLLGLFNRSHMNYEIDRAGDTAGEPSLTEMTELAIEMLSRDNDGFVLIVEAARIDHAHHLTNAHRALTETIELSDAVERTLQLVDTSETLVIVTADHGQGLSFSGRASRGNDILGLVDTENAADGLPYLTLSYATGPEQHREPDGSRQDLSGVDVLDPDFVQAAQFPRAASAHSGEDVPIYAIGPRSHRLGKVLGQAEIGRIIRVALNLFHG